MDAVRLDLKLLSSRRATPQDAEGISHLFLTSYASGKDQSAQRLYPFPQFLNPVWLRHATPDPNLCWLVAERKGEVVGTVGAIVNIGTPRDRVAECFGLVVKESLRRQGVASELFSALTEELAPHASFVIAETRTANLGGWRVVRRNGFVPIGYEPFAHTTPAGSEAMLLTARVDEQAMHAREPLRTSKADYQRVLAGAVLREFGLPIPSGSNQSGAPIAYPLRPQPNANKPSRAGERSELEGEWRVSIEEVTERAEAGLPPHLSSATSGVVRLRRLEGRDPRGERYQRFLLSGEVAGEQVAWARLVWDALDRRARLLQMAASLPEVQGLMVAAALKTLRRLNMYKFSLVVDVRTDDPVLMATLEGMGFFPTAYYPAFIASNNGRIDCVQYTALVGQDLSTGLPSGVRVTENPGESVAAAMLLGSNDKRPS